MTTLVEALGFACIVVAAAAVFWPAALALLGLLLVAWANVGAKR